MKFHSSSLYHSDRTNKKPKLFVQSNTPPVRKCLVVLILQIIMFLQSEASVVGHNHLLSLQDKYPN